jgi:hypothetical protein
MREQAANAERIRKENIEVFTRMFISLGPDAIRVAGQSYDAQLAKARGLASLRWSRLLDMEAQAQREEAALASRPKQRPSQPSDDTVPDRTLAKWNAAWEGETQSARDGLKLLKQEAARERKELESYRADFKKGR